MTFRPAKNKGVDKSALAQAGAEASTFCKAQEAPKAGNKLRQAVTSSLQASSASSPIAPASPPAATQSSKPSGFWDRQQVKLRAGPLGMVFVPIPGSGVPVPASELISAGLAGVETVATLAGSLGKTVYDAGGAGFGLALYGGIKLANAATKATGLSRYETPKQKAAREGFERFAGTWRPHPEDTLKLGAGLAVAGYHLIGTIPYIGMKAGDAIVDAIGLRKFETPEARASRLWAQSLMPNPVGLVHGIYRSEWAPLVARHEYGRMTGHLLTGTGLLLLGGGLLSGAGKAAELGDVLANAKRVGTLAQQTEVIPQAGKVIELKATAPGVFEVAPGAAEKVAAAAARASEAMSGLSSRITATAARAWHGVRNPVLDFGDWLHNTVTGASRVRATEPLADLVSLVTETSTPVTSLARTNPAMSLLTRLKNAETGLADWLGLGNTSRFGPPPALPVMAGNMRLGFQAGLASLAPFSFTPQGNTEAQGLNIFAKGNGNNFSNDINLGSSNNGHVIISDNDMPLENIVIQVGKGPDNNLTTNLVRQVRSINPDIHFTTFELGHKLGENPLVRELGSNLTIFTKRDMWPVFSLSSYFRDYYHLGWNGSLYGPTVTPRSNVGSEYNFFKIAEAAQKNAFQSPALAPGGDLRFFTKPDGQQLVIFGPATLGRVARQFNIDPRDNASQLTGLFIDHLSHEFSIRPENVMPFGRGIATYQQQLSSGVFNTTMSPETFSVLNKLPYSAPINSYFLSDYSHHSVEAFSYHTDLLINSLDGNTFYVNSGTLRAHPQIFDLARYFNVETVELPSASLLNPTRMTRTSYLNWIMGVYENKRFLFLPTQGEVKNLTYMDQQALDILRTRNPQVEILPLGANSADMYVGGCMRGNYGPRCLTNYLLNSR